MIKNNLYKVTYFVKLHMQLFFLKQVIFIAAVCHDCHILLFYV